MNLIDKIDLLISELDEENRKSPCRENSLIKTKLQEAKFWAEEKNRVLGIVAKPEPQILTEPAPLAASETGETPSENAPVPEILTEQQP